MLGLENIGDKSVEDAHAAVNDVLVKIDPLLTKIFMMARALISYALNRVKLKIDIHADILPDPGPNPPPSENQTPPQ